MEKPKNNTDIVILCGGLGKRLRSVCRGKPKPMAEFGRHPFIEILINYIASFGFRRFILGVGYKASLIKNYYRNGSKNSHLKILFSEEKSPLGTGGALKKAKKFIRSNSFIVLNGDSFCKIDFLELLEFHRKKKALMTMVLTKKHNAKDCGSVNLDKNLHIVDFCEKKASKNNGFTNAGIYVFEKGIFNSLPQREKFSLEKDFFSKQKPNKSFGYKTDKLFIDIGTPERYEKAKILLHNAKF